MKKLLSMRKNKKGFFSIELVIAGSVLMMIIMLGTWFSLYLYPRISLSQEVHSLAQIAKIQGGLSDMSSGGMTSDVERFKDMLEERGYDREKIEVNCRTESRMICLGTSSRLEEGGYYIHRDDKDYMYVQVAIPVKVSFFEGAFRYFGLTNNLPREYAFQEVVLSERW